MSSSEPLDLDNVDWTKAIVCYAKCEACQCLQCPGGVHDWAGPDDIAHAAKTGQASPVGQKCGCWCALEPFPTEPDEPDMDSITATPYPVCGESGACAYDADDLPLIHALNSEDDS